MDMLNNCASLGDPVPENAGNLLFDQLGVRFPEFHLEVLRQRNGFSFYKGGFRWLSFGGEFDMVEWNRYHAWKFSWGLDLSDFFCFFESAIGLQYAYKLSELKHGISRVYELDQVMMKSELLEESIEEFWQAEVLRNYTQPYDSFLKGVVEYYGRIPEEKTVIHSPSLLLSAGESVEKTQMLHSRTAMILNGDIFRQLANEPMEKQVKELKLYKDEHSNQRIQVVWS